MCEHPNWQQWFPFVALRYADVTLRLARSVWAGRKLFGVKNPWDPVHITDHATSKCKCHSKRGEWNGIFFQNPNLQFCTSPMLLFHCGRGQHNSNLEGRGSRIAWGITLLSPLHQLVHYPRAFRLYSLLVLKNPTVAGCWCFLLQTSERRASAGRQEHGAGPGADASRQPARSAGTVISCENAVYICVCVWEGVCVWQSVCVLN